MKKLLLFLLFILVCTSIYYDITEGTLFVPTPETNNSSTSHPSSSANLDDQTKIEVTVEPGQTVLSVVEKLHDGPVPASIEQISSDFEKLNNGLSPEKIQVDKSYFFPVYDSSS
ncbi:hypothetical protein ACE1TI_13120 [Alteribacillus sp. JSM 102045]|uniref:hypothetical protein n=1 Tax=Alteribacillus sp. JSM 102045 TaxID=1562101 RepID=UPI0035C04C10